MLHAVRHLVEVDGGSERCEPRGRAASERDRAAQPASPPPGSAAGRASASAAARARAPARPPAAARRAAGSRSGAKRRARFEGGQMPIHMRMRKLRGPHMKKSMPFEPFRTHTQPVNIADLEAASRPAPRSRSRLMQAKGLATRKDDPGQGARQGRAQQGAHRARPRLQRKAARERIEAAGGTCQRRALARATA